MIYKVALFAAAIGRHGSASAPEPIFRDGVNVANCPYFPYTDDYAKWVEAEKEKMQKEEKVDFDGGSARDRLEKNTKNTYDNKKLWQALREIVETLPEDEDIIRDAFKKMSDPRFEETFGEEIACGTNYMLWEIATNSGDEIKTYCGVPKRRIAPCIYTDVVDKMEHDTTSIALELAANPWDKTFDSLEIEEKYPATSNFWTIVATVNKSSIQYKPLKEMINAYFNIEFDDDGEKNPLERAAMVSKPDGPYLPYTLLSGRYDLINQDGNKRIYVTRWGYNHTWNTFKNPSYRQMEPAKEEAIFSRKKDKYSQADIKQQSGTCYFQNVMAGLACTEKGICFLDKHFRKIQGKDKYMVTLYSWDGTPADVEVDIQADVKLFAQKTQKPIWPEMYEQAVAKIYGNYNLIEGGRQMNICTLLTGKPGTLISIEDKSWLDTVKKELTKGPVSMLLSVKRYWDKEKMEYRSTDDLREDGTRAPHSSHAYCLKAVEEKDGDTFLTFVDPNGASNILKKEEHDALQDNIYNRMSGIFHQKSSSFRGKVLETIQKAKAEYEDGKKMEENYRLANKFGECTQELKIELSDLLNRGTVYFVGLDLDANRTFENYNWQTIARKDGTGIIEIDVKEPRYISVRVFPPHSFIPEITNRCADIKVKRAGDSDFKPEMYNTSVDPTQLVREKTMHIPKGKTFIKISAKANVSILYLEPDEKVIDTDCAQLKSTADPVGGKRRLLDPNSLQHRREKLKRGLVQKLDHFEKKFSS